MPTIYRAETIGSLLRPHYLLEAREALEQGRIDTAEFKRVEDRAVDSAIALQEGVGLDVVTDGELRRFSFFDHLLTQIEGVTASEATPGARFHGENRGQEWDFHSPTGNAAPLS